MRRTRALNLSSAVSLRACGLWSGLANLSLRTDFQDEPALRFPGARRVSYDSIQESRPVLLPTSLKNHFSEGAHLGLLSTGPPGLF